VQLTRPATRTELPHAEVIEMRSDDDDLVRQRALAQQQAADVLAVRALATQLGLDVSFDSERDDRAALICQLAQIREAAALGVVPLDQRLGLRVAQERDRQLRA
jgi:hypothetical protein